MHRMIYNMNLLTQKSNNGSTCNDSQRIPHFPYLMLMPEIFHEFIDTAIIVVMYFTSHLLFLWTNVHLKMVNCSITSCRELVVGDLFSVFSMISAPRSCNETNSCMLKGLEILKYGFRFKKMGWSFKFLKFLEHHLGILGVSPSKAWMILDTTKKKGAIIRHEQICREQLVHSPVGAYCFNANTSFWT